LKRSKGGAGRSAVSLRIEGIEKRFGETRALDGADFEIGEGEFFTLLGPSGCGKTTLLRSIAGFERPTSGRILFNGEDLTFAPPWEKSIGFVFQNYALWPNKTVFKNVAYGLELRKLSAPAIKKKVEWALDLVGLPGTEDKLPEQLSGGQQQRIAIARALVIDPELLLLDEPLSNLDTKLRVSLRAQIREIQRKLGITAVYVTHDQEEALELSDRIAVMNKGRVLQIGGPEDIYERPADRFVADFVGKANMVEGEARDGVFTAGGALRLPLPGGADSSDRVPEGRATLMFRPEAVTVVGAGPGAQLQGRVETATYLGNVRRYLIDAGLGSPVLLEGGARLQPGERVCLAIERYRLFA
jgi:iron(III) transport system ATP-binding protein